MTLTHQRRAGIGLYLLLHLFSVHNTARTKIHWYTGTLALISPQESLGVWLLPLVRELIKQRFVNISINSTALTGTNIRKYVVSSTSAASLNFDCKYLCHTRGSRTTHLELKASCQTSHTNYMQLFSRQEFSAKYFLSEIYQFLKTVCFLVGATKENMHNTILK